MRGLNGPSRGRFFIAKGGRACGRLMFPRPRTKKDSRPSSQSQKCLRREKETKLYMDGDGGEETHKCGERRSRTVHNWHAAGGFHCPPPLPLCMQRRIYVYGSQRGGHSSPWRSPPLLLLLLLLLHFRLLCACA
jgi:hypothetical protein